nr:MAG TPA: Cro protein regulating protein [Inoviridae sp.]
MSIANVQFLRRKKRAQHMNELTEIILEKKQEGESTRSFLEKFGVTSQKFYNWKKGATPEDKILMKISEVLNLDFLMLASLARSMDNNSDAATRSEWRKIYNHRKEELSRKKAEKRIKLSANITASLE